MTPSLAFMTVLHPKLLQLWSRITITGFIAVAGLILSICNATKQSTESKRNAYEESAFRYYTELAIPQIRFLLSFKGEFVFLDSTASPPTVILQLRYDTARVRIYLQNTSNAHANLVGYSIEDSATTAPTLRTRILETDEPLNVEGWNLFYKEFSIPPKSLDSVDVTFILSKNPGARGVFHFALFYENQRRVLFDSYCWMPYRLEEPNLSQRTPVQIPQGSVFHFKESNQKLSDQLVRIEDRRVNPKLYTYDETKRFRERIGDPQSQ